MIRPSLLYLNVLIIATCGLIYELLAGTMASYVLGDSVTQFSLIIGIYLSAMGVGSWLSRFLEKGLARRFVESGLPADRVAMVGDDLEADVEGAVAAGLMAIALRTGKYTPDIEARAHEASTAVLDSLAELPGWLGIAGL